MQDSSSSLTVAAQVMTENDAALDTRLYLGLLPIPGRAILRCGPLHPEVPHAKTTVTLQNSYYFFSSPTFLPSPTFSTRRICIYRVLSFLPSRIPRYAIHEAEKDIRTPLELIRL